MEFIESYPYKNIDTKKRLSPEKDTKDLLILRLKDSGFIVHDEVSCRSQGKWDKGSKRIDILAIPSPSWILNNKIHTLGIEVKTDGLSTGEGLVEPVFQASTYASSYSFIKDGELLPRPSIILIASLEIIKNPIDLIYPKTPLEIRTKLADRFAWKFGCSIISQNNEGNIGFWSNISKSNGATYWHTLFKKKI